LSEKLSELPATIDLNPSGGQAQASVIWMHGLGADGNDFVPMIEQFKQLKNQKVRFVFPHAPIRPVTVNGGMKMRAWYDIAELDLSRQEDMIGIKESEKRIHLLIEREESLSIASNKIVLAGFSQGGAMALYAGLRFPKPLAGIIALSCYLPSPISFAAERHSKNQNTPIFMAHGLFDPVVPLMLGQMSKDQLEGLGYPVDWHSYSMPHSVLPEEIKDIDEFLQRIL